VTEREWLACTNPKLMLEFLWGKATERKMRLFACACVRRFWSHLTDERSRRAVGVAEREADGSGGEEVLRLAERDAKAAIPSLSLAVHPSDQAAAAGAIAVVNADSVEASRLACGWGRNVSLALAYEQKPGDLIRAKDRACADWDGVAVALLLDLFRTLFRPVVLDPAWLAPNVVNLAQAIYDERAFHRLPFLADTLEEAGCQDAEILDHCRSDGPHVRGCWVVDLILGKK
jgi:hypothetical protein